MPPSGGCPSRGHRRRRVAAWGTTRCIRLEDLRQLAAIAALLSLGLASPLGFAQALCGGGPLAPQRGVQWYRGYRGHPGAPRVVAAAGSGEALLNSLVDLAATADEAELAARVDTDFAGLTPECLSSLQVRLGAAQEAGKQPLQRLTQCIQASMEARMEKAKGDIDALLMSSGDINANIRATLAKQDSPLPMMAVLQMNIAKAKQAGQQQQQDALEYVFKLMSQELEKQVPEITRLLSKLLSQPDAEARRAVLRDYLMLKGEERQTREMELADAIVQLVADCEKQYEDAPPEDSRRMDALGIIRRTAIDAGVVIGDVYGDDEQSEFTNKLQPLFEALSRKSN